MPPPVPQAQPQPGYGYPPQYAPEQVRTEPPRRAPDPASYDLGSYGLPTQPAAAPPAQGWDPRGAPPAQQQRPWPAQPQPQLDAFGYPAAPPAGQGHQPGPQAYPAGGQGHSLPNGQHPHGQQPEYEEEYEVEEPPRRRRRWLVAAALVGAIGIGSAMAYGYKTFMGPRTATGKDQVVRASREPVKVAPADRGGKQFANTDSRVLNNRVPSEGSSAASGGAAGGAGTVDSNGVRRVATVPVGPGGSTPSAAPPPAVPGMMVVGPTPASVALPPPNLEPPPRAPVAAAAPPPPVADTRAAARPAAPVARAPVAETSAPPVKQAAVVTPKAPAPDRPKTVGGVVAVLGFQKTQLEAMKMMADLQQKYEVLRDKRLEVVQSDQTARGLGVIYRVVVGPRGSVSQARKVCDDLFAAGMGKQGCYPLGQ